MLLLLEPFIEGGTPQQHYLSSLSLPGDKTDFVMVGQKTATEVGQELEVQQDMEEGCPGGDLRVNRE